MKSKFLTIFSCFLLLVVSLSGCSDFRKAVGKEKVIPDEFSVLVTPSIIIPPGYKIDPEVIKGANLNKSRIENDLIKNLNIENKNNVTSFQELFISKGVPKNIRKIVDEESLGISLSERTGLEILFGVIPETGVILDGKNENLRIRRNSSTPSPAFEKNTGKTILIK
jgi:hypothetical protein